MTTTESRIGEVVVGSFRLKSVIGEGSFAVCYLAEQIGTDRLAAVKITRAHLIHGPHGDQIRSRFAAELRASTRVTHPNIATVYTAGETDDGLPVLVMEYVSGASLNAYLTRYAPLPVRLVQALFQPLIGALAEVHSVGVIHRDVTPENIMLTAEGKPMLLDFGVAKVARFNTGLTIGPLGTPRYMAPEQVSGQATPRSDIFSLGMIVWWALTGKENIDDEDHQLQSMLAARLRADSAPNPRDIDPSLPEGISSIVRQMLHPDPEERPTARALLNLWENLGDAPPAESSNNHTLPYVKPSQAHAFSGSDSQALPVRHSETPAPEPVSDFQRRPTSERVQAPEPVSDFQRRPTSGRIQAPSWITSRPASRRQAMPPGGLNSETPDNSPMALPLLEDPSFPEAVSALASEPPPGPSTSAQTPPGPRSPVGAPEAILGQGLDTLHPEEDPTPKTGEWARRPTGVDLKSPAQAETAPTFAIIGQDLQLQRLVWINMQNIDCLLTSLDDLPSAIAALDQMSFTALMLAPNPEFGEEVDDLIEELREGHPTAPPLIVLGLDYLPEPSSAVTACFNLPDQLRPLRDLLLALPRVPPSAVLDLKAIEGLRERGALAATLKIFVSTMPQRIVELESAARDHDTLALDSMARHIERAAAMIGARAIERTARDLRGPACLRPSVLLATVQGLERDFQNALRALLAL